MQAGIVARDKEDELALIINDEDQATWTLSAVLLTQGKHNYIAYSVVQQLIREAYRTGFNTGGKQLAAIKAILGDRS